MINPDLDILKLKESFSKREILIVKDFCIPSFASKVHTHLNNLPHESWFVSCCPIAEGVKKHKNFRDIEKNQFFIKHFRKLALDQYEKDNYAYRFKRTWYENDLPPEGAELELKKMFEGKNVLQIIKKITGKDISKTAGFFSSCYERGDFLARHNDGNNGLLGFVYYVTRNWDESWGGNIEFMDRNSLTPYHSIFPGYNQLLLFSIKDLPNLQHEVKMLTKAARGKRLAFSGWFK